MEGGIAILLLVIIAAIAVVVGIALYLTGGSLWFGKTSPAGDRVEGDAGPEPRSTFKRVDNPEPERVRLAGTSSGERTDED
jgi:hypothetical protein